jgi:hypothetical protein
MIFLSKALVPSSKLQNSSSFKCFLIIGIFIYSICGNAFGQACNTGCDYVFDNATGGPAIPNNAAPKLICITALTRTANINLNNTQNATVCISENTTISGSFTNVRASTVINNYGQYGTSGTPRNLTLGTGGAFNNFGNYFGNFTSNNGANISNSGDIIGNVTLNSGSAVYTNTGTQTGNLTANSGTTLNNSGVLTLSGANLNSGSNITNFSGGSISVSGNLNINATVNNQGNFSITGNLTVNGGASLTNSGQIDVGNNFTNNNITNSQNGSMNIGGNLTNNGSGTLNIGSGNVGGDATNNGEVNIFGELNIDGNLTVNGSGDISAGNDEQINYLFVGGSITLNGCLNGIDGTLIVNQLPSGCTVGIVAVGASSGCLSVIEIPIDDDAFERVYVFTCSTGWVVPGPTVDEEPLDEAQILIVAGGGGGGRGSSAGGGGAGGLIFSDSELLPFGTAVPVIVGTGGAGSTNTNARGADGTNTSFLAFTAIGGGGGGSVTSNAINRNGAIGGSGGGGARQGSTNGVGGNGTASQGNNGANGGSPPGNRGGGGGGAGGIGLGAAGNGNRNGGPGRSFDISGSSIIYSAGGGATSTGPGANGNGFGGDGVGGDANGTGTNRNGRTPGSGGGATSTASGGNGANGAVIIRQTFRILPVEYLYFEASFRRQERLVELRWATGKEWENSHFEVERSLNNVKNWERIGRVEGQGYSDGPVEYMFKDEKPPLVGGNLYYRLKQVDFSRTYSHSKVVSVQVPSVEITKGVWRAYPNPNRGEDLRVELINSMAYDGEEVTVKIVTPTGFSKQVRGKDMLEISSELGKVILTSPKGVYVLEIQWGRKLEYIKILKD